MSDKGTIDVEKAVEELYEYLRDADVDTVAALYEYTFGAVESCWPSVNDPDTFIIEYVEGCEPKE